MKKKNTSTIVIIVVVCVLVLGILAGGITAVVMWFKRVSSLSQEIIKGSGEIIGGVVDELKDAETEVPSTEEPTEEAEPFSIEFGSFKYETDQYGFNKTELEVKVTNTSEKMKTFYIEIEAVNEDGSRLGQESIVVQSLNPGQSQTVKTFEFVSADKLEAFKNAKFKVLKFSDFDS